MSHEKIEFDEVSEADGLRTIELKPGWVFRKTPHRPQEHVRDYDLEASELADFEVENATPCACPICREGLVKS